MPRLAPLSPKTLLSVGCQAVQLTGVSPARLTCPTAAGNVTVRPRTSFDLHAPGAFCMHEAARGKTAVLV